MRPKTIKVENTKLEIAKITPQQGCHSCESRNPVDYERFELVELVQSLPCTVIVQGLCGEICTESRKMEIAKMRLLRESILKFTRNDKLTKDINERNDPNGIISYLIIEMPKSCSQME